MPENAAETVRTALAAGDLAAAARAVAAAGGSKSTRLPDFKLRPRDPRQDLQYGGSLILVADPAPYKAADAAFASGARKLAPCAGATVVSGACAAVVGRWAEAEKRLTRALAEDKLCGWAWAWRGIARSLSCREERTQKGLEAALGDLDRAVSLGGPASAFALTWRAEIRHDLEDGSGALEDLELVLENDPASRWARVERGEILCEAGRTEEALEEFDRLVKENPKAAWALSLRGRTLATSGREADALADLQKAVRLSPRDAATRAWLGEALRKLGRYKESRTHLETALRNDPKFVLAWIWRGRIALALGKPDEALRDLDKAIKLDGRYQLAFAWRGEAKFKLGRYREATADFRRNTPMDLRRTWNPVVKEGETVTREGREKAYWDDLSRAVQRRPKDRFARALWESALNRIPGAPAPREAVAA